MIKLIMLIIGHRGCCSVHTDTQAVSDAAATVVLFSSTHTYRTVGVFVYPMGVSTAVATGPKLLLSAACQSTTLNGNELSEYSGKQLSQGDI
jgi:hypothetical protein